jgi:myo-inositol-1-phosphate synthase
LWLIGAFGGVGTTAALGLAALRRELADSTSLVTALPLFEKCPLDPPSAFVIGGHDIRRTSFAREARDLRQRANVFSSEIIERCLPELEEWTGNVRPGSVLHSGPAIGRLAEIPEAQAPETSREVIERLQRDLRNFQEEKQLDQIVMVHVASTEPPFELGEAHGTLGRLNTALGRGGPGLLPSSSLYAWAALDLGLSYVNFTPSLGANVPALIDLAKTRGSPVAGSDGKTGETLLKSVLAPMFALRNWEVLSWVGHNIFGNRDGLVLDEPANKASKLRSKDRIVGKVLGYKPQTHVSIEYIRSLDDWKTAWDFIHFRGFLGTKMSLQFTWQGCDSILAAPLIIDLARLALWAQRRGEGGVQRHLACFFKSPMAVEEQDFFKQFAMLEAYVKSANSEGANAVGV